MKKRHLFTSVGLLGALSFTGIAFAATNASTDSTNVSVSAAGFVSVAAANGTDKTISGGNYGKKPSWAPTANSAGSVTGGDLYVITPDSAGTTGNFVATLYLSNPGELSQNYNYINFHVSVYKFSGSTWTQVANTPTYLSLANGYVTFDLPAPGSTEAYGISIDDGSYYCVNAPTDGSLAPNFYLTVKPA